MTDYCLTMANMLNWIIGSNLDGSYGIKSLWTSPKNEYPRSLSWLRMAERLVHMFGVPAWRHFKKDRRSKSLDWINGSLEYLRLVTFNDHFYKGNIIRIDGFDNVVDPVNFYMYWRTVFIANDPGCTRIDRVESKWKFCFLVATSECCVYVQCFQAEYSA